MHGRNILVVRSIASITLRNAKNNSDLVLHFSTYSGCCSCCFHLSLNSKELPYHDVCEFEEMIKARKNACLDKAKVYDDEKEDHKHGGENGEDK